MEKQFFMALFFLWCTFVNATPSALVLQSDFGLGDGAVSAMQGVSYEVSPDLRIFDLTHEIPTYDIWMAALTLQQVASYWPAGTVFVSVVDPGVGTNRKSVVLETMSGHYFVTPDNGTLTFVADSLGIKTVREINEAVNRRQDSTQSYTFHGRDVYAYTGARLASGMITFEDVGAELQDVEMLSFEEGSYDVDTEVLLGTIFKLDVRYGNVWSNLSKDLFMRIKPTFGDIFNVVIKKSGKIVYRGQIPYVATFGKVAESEPLIYLNSLLDVSIALNMDDFAGTHGIGYGPEWTIELSKIK